MGKLDSGSVDDNSDSPMSSLSSPSINDSSNGSGPKPFPLKLPPRPMSFHEKGLGTGPREESAGGNINNVNVNGLHSNLNNIRRESQSPQINYRGNPVASPPPSLAVPSSLNPEIGAALAAARAAAASGGGGGGGRGSEGGGGGNGFSPYPYFSDGLNPSSNLGGHLNLSAGNDTMGGLANGHGSTNGRHELNLGRGSRRRGRHIQKSLSDVMATTNHHDHLEGGDIIDPPIIGIGNDSLSRLSSSSRPSNSDHGFGSNGSGNANHNALHPHPHDIDLNFRKEHRSSNPQSGVNPNLQLLQNLQQQLERSSEGNNNSNNINIEHHNQTEGVNNVSVGSATRSPLGTRSNSIVQRARDNYGRSISHGRGQQQHEHHSRDSQNNYGRRISEPTSPMFRNDQVILNQQQQQQNQQQPHQPPYLSINHHHDITPPQSTSKDKDRLPPMLDMRSYEKLEDAILEVKVFLEDVKKYVTDEGLDAEDDDGGKLSSFFVTIVIGSEGGSGSISSSSRGGALKSILRKIFLNQGIHFIDSGQVLSVDALSIIEPHAGGDVAYDDDKDVHGNINYAQLKMKETSTASTQMEAQSAQSSFHHTPSYAVSRNKSQFDELPQVTRQHQQQQGLIADDYHRSSSNNGNIHSNLGVDHSSNHGVAQDNMPTLDMRSYRKLEDAIVEVKLFLDHVKQKLASERGLHTSFVVTVVTGGGEGNSASGALTKGAVLKSVLGRIFCNQNIQYIDSEDGESLLIDALSGVRDDEDSYNREQQQQQYNQKNNYDTVAAYDLEPNDPVADPPYHFNTRSHGESGDPSGSNGARHFDNRLNQLPSRLTPPSFDGHEPLPASPPFRTLQHDAVFDHRQHEPLTLPQLPGREELPFSRITQQTAQYPQDHGAGMLYNPFDSIAHTLLQREHSESSSNSARSNPYHNALIGVGGVVPPSLDRDHLNGADESGNNFQREQPQRFEGGLENMMAVHDPTMVPLTQRQRPSEFSSGDVNHRPSSDLMRHESRSSAVHQHLTGNPKCASEPFLDAHNPGGDHPSHPQQHDDTHKPQLSAAAEAALQAAMRAKAQSSSNINDGRGSSHGCNTGESSRSRNAHHYVPTQRAPANSCSTILDAGFEQAITHSQAAHIAHTRQQVAHDIQFRRALDMATNASEIENVPQNVTSACSSNPEADEEQLFEMAARRSLLDEQARQEEIDKKYEAELMSALRQSQELDAMKQEEEHRTKETEEEVLRKVLVQSQAEEMQALEHMQREEQMLRRVMMSSLEKDSNVSEDGLVDEVIRNSLSNSEDGRRSLNGGKGAGPTAEETLEQVLKLSLEDKEYVAEEEEEEIRKAMERSLTEQRFGFR